MWLLALACSPSSSTEDSRGTPPDPPLHTEVLELRRAMGRASVDADAACAAVDSAQILAQQVDAAVQDGSFDWESRGSGAPGLTRDDGRIVVDWPELALAVGPGPANIALITVGGATPRGGCSNPRQLAKWTARGRTLDAAPSCMEGALKNAYAATVQTHLDHCLCDTPSPADTTAVERLAPLLETMELDEVAQQVRAWPERWEACTPEAEPTEP